jgi:hypothetical protein
MSSARARKTHTHTVNFSRNAFSDLFNDTALLDFEVKALKRVRARWGRCACAVVQDASLPALLLGGNRKIGLFG